MNKSALRRAGWGLVGGALISTIPYLLAKFGSSAAPPLFALLLPGDFVGIAIGGWNARILTVFFVVLTNIALYTAIIYAVLTRLESRKQAKRNVE